LHVLAKFAVVAYSIGVVNAEGQKSSDFSLGFPQIERRSFLLGETGFSDSTGALPKRRDVSRRF